MGIIGNNETKHRARERSNALPRILEPTINKTNVRVYASNSGENVSKIFSGASERTCTVLIIRSELGSV